MTENKRYQTVIKPLRSDFYEQVTAINYEDLALSTTTKNSSQNVQRNIELVPNTYRKVQRESCDEIRFREESSIDECSIATIDYQPCAYYGCPFSVDPLADWVNGNSKPNHCCQNHANGNPEHDDLCPRLVWKKC